METTKKEVLVEPVYKSSLSEMLGKITEQNIHKEIKADEPVGKEIW